MQSVMGDSMRNIPLLSLTLFCCSSFAEVDSVIVFDAEFNKINELTKQKYI